MCTRSAKLRHAAYLKQSGRCYYCGLRMWESAPQVFAKANKLELAKAMLLQCTAEHLKARVDGGRNAKGNIVAACLSCNQARHRSKDPLSPPAYKQEVRQRTESGRWHGKKLVGLLTACGLLFKQ